MVQSNGNGTKEKRQDVSDCRVRRLDNGTSICLMKPNCAYALPFGNICSHPQVNRIASSIYPPH